MAAQIKAISDKQWAAIYKLREDVLRIGLCCEPLDKIRAKTAIDALYSELKLPQPIYLFFTSPMICIFAHTILSRDQLYGQLSDQLSGQLRDQLRGQLSDQLSGQLRDQLRDQLSDQLSNYFAGQHWGYWQSFYRAGLLAGATYSRDQVSKLSEWEAEAAACHWWFPYTGAILVSDRHREVHFDSRRRLHHEKKPAIVYSDGWGVYAIHGVRVPEQYISAPADKIDPINVMNETNAQVRMAVISKIGFVRMLGKLPHKIISTNSNTRGLERSDELIEFNLGNETRVRGLHVWWREKSGEEKENVIPVWRTREQFGEDCPEDIDDCEAVRRWVMRLPKDAEIAEEV